jgi:hypothetical protein
MCQNSEAAYKTVKQREAMKNPATGCPRQNVCINTVSEGGTGNVVKVSQNSNCGGAMQKIADQIKLHPILAVAIIVLVVSLIILVASPEKVPEPALPKGVNSLGTLPASQTA